MSTAETERDVYFREQQKKFVGPDDKVIMDLRIIIKQTPAGMSYKIFDMVRGIDTEFHMNPLNGKPELEPNLLNDTKVHLSEPLQKIIIAAGMPEPAPDQIESPLQIEKTSEIAETDQEKK